MSKMQAWNIINSAGRCIETVFFEATMTEDEVLGSLIAHDGYPYSISVRKAKMW